MNCPNCDETNREIANFCRRCGQWLGKTCPSCHQPLPDTPVFCDQCGYQVSPVPAAGRQWLAQETQPDSPQIIPRNSSNRSTIAHRPAAQTATDLEDSPAISASLQKYIPKELMKKLEAARASGTMAGERRVVTMLFCDVKGSTAAAERLDPEEWTEVINGAFESMIKPVYMYEGTVARLMGDALLAFFGAPIAHEDDPQRAVLAGLEMIHSLETYREVVMGRYGIELNVRVGINTGPVVVGAVGSDLRMEYTAMGDAINLAARMEQTAQPGTVQIAHDTYRLVAPLFEIKTLGGISIKGKNEPVLAYQVLGRKAQAGRLRGIAGQHVPLVGRVSEMSALKEACGKVQKGVGGIISLIGEAGLGKSRLIRELKEEIQRSPEIFWIETSSQSYETSQPYNMFRRLTRRMIDAAPNDPAGVVRQKIRTFTETTSPAPDNQVQRVLESLFGLESESGDPPFEGETFKQLFHAATRSLWEARAARQPTVVVCDDLHWADSASAELLAQLFELTEKVPLLIVCSLRPERHSPGWNLKSEADSEYLHRYTELQLKPLSMENSSELLNKLAPGAEIPGHLRQRILDKAAGIPYYLEEVVRGLMDSRALIQENGAFSWGAAEDFTDFDLPDSLQSLLVARIDRLGEDARRTLQLASVVGRSFYYRVLARMEETTQSLDQQLEVLMRDHMIREAAREPEVEYTFNNILTQEAAYQTILHRHRRQFHRQVGEALESLYPERREELAPVLAVHFSEADDLQRTLEYRLVAGDAAYRMYALDEAIGHYRKALDLARGAEENDVTSDQLIHLYTRLGRAYEHRYQYDQVQKTYEDMRVAADQRADRDLELAYLLALGTVNVTITPLQDPEAGRTRSEEALILAKELGDRQAEAKGHWNLMLLYRFQDLQAAKYHGEISLTISRDLAWEEQLAYILNDLGWVYMGLLEPSKALDALEEARGLWRKMGNLPMLSDNLNVSGMFQNYTGTFEKSQEIIQEGIQIAQSINNLWNIIPSCANLSESYLESGQCGEALETIHLAIGASEKIGSENPGLKSLPLFRLAQIWSELGQIGSGVAVCDRLFSHLSSGENSNRLLEAVYALRARLDLAGGDLEKAQTALEKFHPDKNSMTSFPFIDLYLSVIACEIWLASGEYPQVLQLTDEFISTCETAGIRLNLPELMYYHAQALMGTDQPEAAQSALTAAKDIAVETGSRRTLWKILAALAAWAFQAGKTHQAEDMHRQAVQIIEYIAEHAGSAENRQAFLARGDVQQVLEKIG